MIVSDRDIYKDLLSRIRISYKKIINAANLEEEASKYYITLGVNGKDYNIYLNADLHEEVEELLKNMISMEMQNNKK